MNNLDELIGTRRFPDQVRILSPEAVVTLLLLDRVGDVVEGRIVQAHEAPV